MGPETAPIRGAWKPGPENGAWKPLCKSVLYSWIRL